MDIRKTFSNFLHNLGDVVHPDKPKLKYDVAETFRTTNDLTVVNFEREGKTPSRLEGFLAHGLNMLGIKKIFDYSTVKNIGAGEAFENKTGKSKGIVVLQHYGFQKQ